MGADSKALLEMQRRTLRICYFDEAAADLISNGELYGPVHMFIGEEAGALGAREVIDPWTLVPLDKEAILDWVAKTGRLVAVDAAPKACSAASEIAGMVAEEGFWTLRGPISRVASLNTQMPVSVALEKLVFPDDAKIETGILRTLA